MTDRELLELAAKAAGIKWLPATTEKGIELEPKFGLWLVIDGEPNEYQRRRWNPLTDDGDALRLAVRLRITLFQAPKSVIAEPDEDFDYKLISKKEYCDDETRNAATRRAIVRAAAEIGKAI